MFYYQTVIFICSFLICLNLSCGQQVGSARSIDETGSDRASSVSVTDAPFHSYSGWERAILFYVEEFASDQIVEAARDASAVWNDAVGREVLSFSGIVSSKRGDSLYSSLEDDLTVIYAISNWRSSTGKSSSTLATTVWQNAGDSDRIVKGDLLLNVEEYSFLDSMTVSSSTWEGKTVVDSETVIVHEFGHLMGLEHIAVEADADSVMHAKTFIGAKVTSRVPSSLDVYHLKSLYD